MGKKLKIPKTEILMNKEQYAIRPSYGECFYDRVKEEMMLDTKKAESIEGWIKASGGQIFRGGTTTEIRIEGSVYFSAPLLKEWIQWGAEVEFNQGKVYITNWPETKESRFEVTIKGRVSKQAMEYALKSALYPSLCCGFCVKDLNEE